MRINGTFVARESWVAAGKWPACDCSLFFRSFCVCCYTPFGSKNPFFKRRKISFNFVASGSRKKKESRKLSDGKKNIFQATQIKIDVMYERWKKTCEIMKTITCYTSRWQHQNVTKTESIFSKIPFWDAVKES